MLYSEALDRELLLGVVLPLAAKCYEAQTNCCHKLKAVYDHTRTCLGVVLGG